MNRDYEIFKAVAKFVNQHGGMCYISPGDAVNKLRISIDRKKPPRLIKYREDEALENVLMRVRELF